MKGLDDVRTRIAYGLKGAGVCAVIWTCVALSADGVRAQESELDLAPACPSCRIVAEDVVWLGTDAGDGMLPDDPVQVTRDHAGRYWIAFNAPVLPVVYERDGTPLGPVGRPGEGPGEFRMASALTPVADSMVAFDAELGRATVIGPDLAVVRSVRMPGQVWSGAAVGWPRVAINVPTRSRSPDDGPFRLFDLETGALGASFGSAAGAAPTDRVGYVTTSARAERFWIATRLTLRVSEWDVNANRTGALTASPSWFPEGVRGRIGGPDQPPDPVVVGISKGSGPRLWVAVAVARPDWKDGWTRPGGQGGHGGAGLPQPLEIRQSRLLLIDVDERRVIATADRDWLVISLLPDDEVALYDETDPLTPRVRIVRLDVRPS